MMKGNYISIVLGLALLSACSAETETLSHTDESEIIHIGGVEANDLVATTSVTRATESAENVDWLKTALQNGMSIRYYQTPSNTKAVTLKLESDDNYSLKDSEGIPAKWLGNGVHIFEGTYVPEGLKGESASPTHEDLSRYTAVPPMAEISATVGSITIPLQHRLSRVMAYVLIEPGMNTKLKGYNKDNHSSEATMLRFCNVKTLDYVNTDGQPVWKQERKAIPHYLGEQVVKLYKNKSTGKLIFPTDTDWAAADKDYTEKAANSSYSCTDYGMAPYYDLIVRPTYTVRATGTNVMYDEANPTASESNNIDFELTLDNDLEYEKQFVFDLNANDETVVYLRVSPERIDYNSAGSRLWKETSYSDKYYGVNNQNGNNLSKAGSSWQRAFTNGALIEGVTDGHSYDADEEDTEAQYVSNTKFVEMLKQAYQGGTHHGDYFILKSDIEIDLSEFPIDFEFTGHLDAQGHTITLIGITDEHDWLFAGLDGVYTTAQEIAPTNTEVTWEANVHKEGNIWVPTSGWRAEIVNATVVGGKLFQDHTNITGFVKNCKDIDGHVINNIPAIPTY